MEDGYLQEDLLGDNKWGGDEHIFDVGGTGEIEMYDYYRLEHKEGHTENVEGSDLNIDCPLQKATPLMA